MIFRTYRDVEVSIDRGSGYFSFPESEFLFKSYAQCMDAIDAMLKRKAVNEKVRLALPVVNERGANDTIVGVHAGHGGLLLASKTRPECCYPFVASPYVKRLVALSKELQELEWKLSTVSIPVDGWSSKDRTAESVQREYEEKCALAAKLPPLEPGA